MSNRKFVCSGVYGRGLFIKNIPVFFMNISFLKKEFFFKCVVVTSLSPSTRTHRQADSLEVCVTNSPATTIALLILGRILESIFLFSHSLIRNLPESASLKLFSTTFSFSLFIGVLKTLEYTGERIWNPKWIPVLFVRLFCIFQMAIKSMLLLE